MVQWFKKLTPKLRSVELVYITLMQPIINVSEIIIKLLILSIQMFEPQPFMHHEVITLFLNSGRNENSFKQFVNI